MLYTLISFGIQTCRNIKHKQCQEPTRPAQLCNLLLWWGHILFSRHICFFETQSYRNQKQSLLPAEPFLAGATMLGRDPRYCEFRCVSAAGQAQSPSWRLWTNSDGDLRWEMRRIIASGGYAARYNETPCDVMRQEMPQWKAHFYNMHLSDHTFIRSVHAARQKREPVTIEEDQASLSSEGLLALHSYWLSLSIHCCATRRLM